MEVKAKKAKQESNGKRQDERTHNERNRNKEWDTENDKKERETKTIYYRAGRELTAYTPTINSYSLAVAVGISYYRYRV